MYTTFPASSQLRSRRTLTTTGARRSQSTRRSQFSETLRETFHFRSPSTTAQVCTRWREISRSWFQQGTLCLVGLTLLNHPRWVQDLDFDARINLVCSGAKPTLPAEERDALCSSQKSSTFSSYPPLHLRLPQVKLRYHLIWQTLTRAILGFEMLCGLFCSRKSFVLNAPIISSHSHPTQGHKQKHLAQKRWSCAKATFPPKVCMLLILNVLSPISST